MSGLLEAYYTVEVQERGGQSGHWKCRATSPEDARRQAFNAHPNRDDHVIEAKFDQRDIRNREPGSLTKHYRGFVLIDGSCHVYVSNLDFSSRYLNPRTDLLNHSPTGFAWGYEGSGPAQLSLALLADALGDAERALSLYQTFKRELIARIPQDIEWSLGQAVIVAIAEGLGQ